MKTRLNPMECVNRLSLPTGMLRMVLDTDTFNEVDDQFAMMYALASPERLSVEAIHAAPFHNDRSSGPQDGMEKSYDEILRLLKTVREDPDNPHDFLMPVLRGSTRYLPDRDTPVESEAAKDLVQRAMASPSDDPLYVVALGAITNVASAILMEPEIIKRIVIVWLGGHVHHWPHTKEFNLMQDVAAAQVVFNSGVPLIQIPAVNVTSHLLTSLHELQACLGGKNRLCDTLIEIFRGYKDDHFGWSKEIWDISAVAYLLQPAWVPTDLVHSPVLNDACTWSKDDSRHFIRVATSVDRNAIFKDLFMKLASFYGSDDAATER